MEIEKLNPLTYLSQSEYSEIWQNLFATLLYGICGRFVFFVLVALSFWLGVRQRNPALATIGLVLAAIVAYGGGIMNLIRS